MTARELCAFLQRRLDSIHVTDLYREGYKRAIADAKAAVANDSNQLDANVERLVPISEISVRTGFDRTTIARLSKAGKFPRLRRNRDRRVFLLESELVAWMRADSEDPS